MPDAESSQHLVRQQFWYGSPKMLGNIISDLKWLRIGKSCSYHLHSMSFWTKWEYFLENWFGWGCVTILGLLAPPEYTRENIFIPSLGRLPFLQRISARPVTIFWPCPEVVIISDKHCIGMSLHFWANKMRRPLLDIISNLTSFVLFFHIIPIGWKCPWI